MVSLVPQHEPESKQQQQQQCEPFWVKPAGGSSGTGAATTEGGRGEADAGGRGVGVKVRGEPEEGEA